MKLKRKQNPIFGIVIALAVLFTVIEGAFVIIRVMERNLDADMETYDQELTNLMYWAEAEKISKAELSDLYQEIWDKLNYTIGGYEAIYIFDETNTEIMGTSIQYQNIPREDIFRRGEEYFDDKRFKTLIYRLFRESNFRLEKTIWNNDRVERTEFERIRFFSWEFLNAMSSYEFIFPEKAYFQKEFHTDDGAAYTIVFVRNISISGRTVQQMIYLISIYVAVLLIMWVISILQAIARADDYKRLQKVAYFDELTGIINRTRFEIAAKKVLRRRRQKKYALLVADINKFKIINDFYGEEKANEILIGVAEYLREHCEKDELVARDQSDIFLALYSYLEEGDLDRRIRGMDKELRRMLKEYNTKFKYGVYLIQEKEKVPDIRRIMNYAEMAKDRVGTKEDENIFYMDEEQKQHIHREKALENEMENALGKREFIMYLQPKYIPDGSRIVGAEALVRWNSPVLGFIAPGEFIPLFERNGFVMKLDHYMLSQACMQQKKWMEEGKELIPISVNISRVHLMDPKLVEDIVTTVDFYGIPHDSIELELTESAFFEDKQVLINTIRNLQNVGFAVSMDDFGSGYSSLNSLKDLPLDVIKLDGEFFKETEDIDRSNKIVKDTVELARHLEMKIVAEGIEKEEQVNFLQDIGCDLIQGFYYAKPMTVPEFEHLLYGQKNTGNQIVE